MRIQSTFAKFLIVTGCVAILAGSSMWMFLASLRGFVKDEFTPENIVDILAQSSQADPPKFVQPKPIPAKDDVRLADLNNLFPPIPPPMPRNSSPAAQSKSELDRAKLTALRQGFDAAAGLLEPYRGEIRTACALIALQLWGKGVKAESLPIRWEDAAGVCVPAGSPMRKREVHFVRRWFVDGDLLLVSVPSKGTVLAVSSPGRIEEMRKGVARFETRRQRARSVPFVLKGVTSEELAGVIGKLYDRRSRQFSPRSQVRVVIDKTANKLFVDAPAEDVKEIKALIEVVDSPALSSVDPRPGPPSPMNRLHAVALKSAVADDVVMALRSALDEAGKPTVQNRPGAIEASKPLRFVDVRSDKGKAAGIGVLAQIRVASCLMTNTVVVSAPAQVMPLMEKLVRQLDHPPTAKGEVRVYSLKKADAATTAGFLRRHYLPGRTSPAPAPGGMVSTGPVQPINGRAELSIVEDEPTNSIVVQGNPGDFYILDLMVGKFEELHLPGQVTEQRHLKHALAGDLAVALKDRLAREPDLARDVAVTPEPITNVMLVNAAPGRLKEVLRIIDQLDVEPQQVLLQVLLAEVDRGPDRKPKEPAKGGKADSEIPEIVPSGAIGAADAEFVDAALQSLKLQDRFRIRRRPHVVVLDNQTTLIDTAPQIAGLNPQPLPAADAGLVVQVTPKVLPGNKLVLRVVPEIRTEAAKGKTDVRQFASNITVRDGESVFLRGMHFETHLKNDKKVPWLSELPGVGAVFSFRTTTIARKELVIILTPHVVHSREEADRVLIEESKRIDRALNPGGMSAN